MDKCFLMVHNQVTVVYVEDAKTASFVDTLIEEAVSYPIIKSEFVINMKKYELTKQFRAGKISQEEYDRGIWYWEGWDGYASMYDNRQFPTGLLQRVIDTLTGHKIEIEFNDSRTKPTIIPKEQRYKFKGKLRHYQREGEALFFKVGRGILDFSVGTGKTITAYAIMARSNTYAVVLVPKTVILNDWIQESRWLDKPVGYISSNQFVEAPIMIMTYSTLMNALWSKATREKTIKRHERIKEIYKRAGMIVVDEVHHFASDKYSKMIEMSDAYYRLGLSGTVGMRTDEKDIIYYAHVGEIVHSITQEEAMELEYIVETEVEFLNIPFMYLPPRMKYQGKREDTRTVEYQYIINNKDRNMKFVKKAYDMAIKQDRQVIMFVSKIIHGNKLLALIDQYHKMGPYADLLHPDEFNYTFIHGQSKNKDNLEKEYREGKYNIAVFQSQLVGEGFNVPAIAGICIVDGGKSIIRLTQGIGRGVRKHGDKANVKVFDAADQVGHTLGHTRERYLIYKDNPAYKVNVSGTFLAKFSSEVGI
jgi:superfamily II DNA or RNA helicase